jgi:hypothetical protein
LAVAVTEKHSNAVNKKDFILMFLK